jgi:hypothetical protein
MSSAADGWHTSHALLGFMHTVKPLASRTYVSWRAFRRALTLRRALVSPGVLCIALQLLQIHSLLSLKHPRNCWQSRARPISRNRRATKARTRTQAPLTDRGVQRAR